MVEKHYLHYWPTKQGILCKHKYSVKRCSLNACDAYEPPAFLTSRPRKLVVESRIGEIRFPGPIRWDGLSMVIPRTRQASLQVFLWTRQAGPSRFAAPSKRILAALFREPAAGDLKRQAEVDIG